MNSSLKLFIFFIFLGFISCAPDKEISANFDLLPAPQNITLSGSSELEPEKIEGEFEKAKEHFIQGNTLSSFEGKKISLWIDKELDLSAEGYELAINTAQIEIKATAEEGLWYGLMSLSQLLEDASDQSVNLPITEIRDEPALDYRAVHLDVKHHLEKKDYYFKLLDRLAGWKINAIIIEIEDKLAYELQPQVGSSDALTIAEWNEIADYAMARNIRMSPLVQGLGHASFILKHPEYVNLRDDPKSDWAFNPLDEKTYQVQFDLYTDALKAFPHANYLHVGGDEVNTTGRGSGKSPLELQLIWLNRVSEYAEERNLTPIFWDDMPLKNADLYRTIYDRNLTEFQVDSIWAEKAENLNKYVDLFPKNCIYMRWNYDIPESPGNTKAMQWFTENGFQVMGATAGQTRWNLMPQQESNSQNIRDFALSSIENNTKGLLLTLWDDDSPHFELYQRGIATFAAHTWSGDTRTIEELKGAFAQRHFGNEVDQNFIDLLEGPVADWKNMLLEEGINRNRLHNITDPKNSALITLPDLESPGKWTETYSDKIALAEANLQIVEEVLEKIEMAKSKSSRNTYTLEVYEQVAQAVQFSNRAILALAELDESSGEKRNMAQSKIEGMAEEWNSIESNLEEVYSRTRQLDKPEDYILDQDHHVHLANQARKFSDWQFYVEGLFLEKLGKTEN